MHCVRGPTSCVGRKVRRVSEAVEAATSPGSERVACVRVGFPGNPGGLVVSIVKTAGGRAPAHHARGRGRRTWRPTERTAGARMVPPGEGNEARGDGRRGVGVSHSTAEAGELSPRDPVEGRGHRQGHPTSGTTRETHRASPRTPPATGPARSGSHAAYGAPRRHTMPSAQAVVKRGGALGVLQSANLWGRPVTLFA